MAVSAPYDPPFRAGQAASPFPPDLRATDAFDPCLIHRAGAQNRFVPENKTIVPELVFRKLPEFEPMDTARRRLEAGDWLRGHEPFAKRLGLEVSNKMGSDRPEFSAASSAASASN
jgi:hypothetical protein